MMNSVLSISSAVRSKGISATEATHAALARIGAHNDALNAFVHLDVEAALRQAKRIDDCIRQGQDPGLLAGVPVGVKDLENCAGMPTRKGSLLYANAAPATTDSIHCARLRAAGAVFLGKTATAEFGMDAITATRAAGITRNPWNLSLTPGGSSGGSAAAVSAGMVPIATGSDAGGSIRSPAGFTGLVGLKPSHGRIPRDRETLFSCYGALTTTVADTARYLDVVAGPHPADRMSFLGGASSYETAIEALDVTGLRCAWSSDYGYAVMDDEIVHIARNAAEALVQAARLVVSSHELRLRNHRDDWLIVNASRGWHELLASGCNEADLKRMSPRPQAAFRRGSIVDMACFTAAERNLEILRAEFGRFFNEDADILLSPDAATTAFAAEGPSPALIGGRDATDTGVEPLHFVANTCWNPSITIPAGITRDGLPVGLMITCRVGRDDLVLRLAKIWEDAQPWPHLAPGYAAS